MLTRGGFWFEKNGTRGGFWFEKMARKVFLSVQSLIV